MPSITQVLTTPENSYGWAQMGADFYFPGNGYPHLHLRVTNAQNQINDYPDLRNHLVFFCLTYGGQMPNINLMTAPVDNIGNALRALQGFTEPELMALQYRINRITGRGVDI